MIRVLIADDHPVVRRGLRDILKEATDIEVVSEASDGVEVIEKIRKDEPDVLLLDLSMPKPMGLKQFHGSNLKSRKLRFSSSA